MPLDQPTQQTEAELWSSVSKERRDGEAPAAANATPPSQTPEAQVAQPAANQVAAPEATVSPLDLQIQELLASQQAMQASHQALQTKLAEAVGRVSALQSVVDKQARASAQQPAPVAPSSTDVNAALASPEKWAALKAEYPEWAEATEELVRANRVAQAPVVAEQPQLDVQRMREEIKADLMRDMQEATYRTVEAAHPGWLSTIATPAFQAWRQAQAPEVAALGASPHAEDAIRMISLFKNTVANPDTVSAAREAVLANGARQAPAPAPARQPRQAQPQMTEAQMWAEESRQRLARRQAESA